MLSAFAVIRCQSAWCQALHSHGKKRLVSVKIKVFLGGFLHMSRHKCSVQN